jgi:hypothetical protein
VLNDSGCEVRKNVKILDSEGGNQSKDYIQDYLIEEKDEKFLYLRP